MKQIYSVGRINEESFWTREWYWMRESLQANVLDMRVLWMACYHLRQHLCISYASVVGMLAYWFCICCFHLQTSVIMPDERRNIDLELKVGLWICLSSYGMTSISSFKIKCSKSFRCLPNNESFFLLIVDNQIQPTYITNVYMDH